MNLKKKFVCGALVLATVYILFTIYPLSHESRVTELWGQNQSRNTKDYINETAKPHILPGNFCTRPSLLVVFIITAPNQIDARAAIRETWAQKRSNVSFYFLLGEVSDNAELQLKLENEGLEYDDIVQERFIESYYNLTLKSVNMLKLYKQYCSKTAPYLFKIDDDVFFNVHNLVHYLQGRRVPRDLLMGQIYSDSGPIRERSSKWFVPHNWYPDDKYPDYLCGSTYVMSKEVALKLYSCALRTPLFYIEDVFVTGICARKMNVKPRHDPLFSCRSINLNICDLRKYYGVHGYGPRKMRKSYDRLVKKKCTGQDTLVVGVIREFQILRRHLIFERFRTIRCK